MKKLSVIVITTLICLTTPSPVFAGLQTLPSNQTPQEKNDAFKTDLYTGSSTYSYSFQVPQGTNNLTPSVSLSYNSQAAKNPSVYVGSGWQLDGNYIAMDRNYSYETDDDKYKLIFQGSSYKLVDTGNGTYHTEIESFLDIKKLSGAPNTQSTYWQVTSPDGTVYRFGYLSNSEIVCDYNAIERWNLDLVTDTHANKIFYTYNTINNVPYLIKIEYNTDKTRIIDFSYIQRTVTRRVYQDQCSLNDNQKLTNISVRVNNALVRSYDLAYSDQPNEGLLLQSITEKGSDGDSLPPTRFEYKPQITSWQSAPTTWLPIAPDADFRQVNARFIDVTGDGLPDIIKSDYINDSDITWKILRNTGTGWSSTWENWINHGNVDGAHLDNSNVTLADVDGDGLVDIVKSRWDAWFVYKNTGHNWNTEPVRWNDTSTLGGATLDQKNTTTTETYYDNYGNLITQPLNTPYNALIDMNGDGKADVVRTFTNGNNVSEWWVYLSTGASFSPGTQWMAPLGAADLSSRSIRVADVNGDGLPDIVYSYSTDTWRVFTNTGTFLNGGYELWLDHADVNATFNPEDHNPKMALADANGDGLIDIVRSSNHGGPTNSWEVLINKGNRWNTTWETWVPETNTISDVSNDNIRLVDVNNDGLVDIVRSETNGPWDVWKNNGFAPDLLSKITTSNGGNVSFDYTTAKEANNPDVPFPLWIVSSITKDNGLGITATTSYNYDNGTYSYAAKEFRGFGTVTETNAQGTTTSYSFHQDNDKKGKLYFAKTQDSQSNPYTQLEQTWGTVTANSVAQVLLEQTKQSAFDGSPENPRVTQVEYAYNTHGHVVKQSDRGDVTKSDDDRFTYTEYSVNTTNYIVNKPNRITLKGSDDATIVSDQWLYYDNHAYLTDTPTKGDLTKSVNWLNGGNNPVTTFEYDSYGNKIQETDAKNHSTVYTFGDSDPTYTFPSKVTNAKGYQTIFAYDLGTGNVLSQTDANNLTTSYQYDQFGRIKKEIRPFNSSDFPTVGYEYLFDGLAPETTLVSQREVQNLGGTLDKYTSIDGFGNIVQIRVDAEDPDQQIVTDNSYNSLWLVEKTSIPHSDQYAVYSTPLTDIPNTTTVYDVLGRPITITNPDNTSKHTAYDHWVVTNTDENGNQTRQHLNASGKIAQVDEFVAGSTQSTLYEYNSRESLTQITDANGNGFEFTLDSLGRKIAQTDPDLGSWTYSYDAVGNLISQTDANGITIQRQYDELNRLVLVDYPSDPDVIYTYDVDKVGALSQIEDQAGVLTFTYDDRLRKISETRTLDGLTWTTLFAYDSADRLITRTNPDGEIVRFAYNTQGVVDKLNGVIDNLDYNALGKVTQKAFSNSLTTNYSYNSNDSRLNRIQTGSLQDFRYTYDNIGNITSIINAVTGKTQTFTYDQLNRLITAEEADGFDHLYQYDALGNLTKFTNFDNVINYSYGLQSKPHALISSSEETVPTPTPIPTPIPQTEINVVYQKPVSVDSTYNSYIANFAVDGLTDNTHRWLSSNTNGPHWAEVDLGDNYVINRWIVYSGWFNGTVFQDPIASFVLQYWNGASWVDVPNTLVTNNTSDQVSQAFSESVTTNKVRFYTTTNGYVRLRDLEVYGYLDTPTPTPTPPDEGTELLSSPWHLSGNNGDAQLYQSIDPTALNGKTALRITYDLHGLYALDNDASAIIFDQNGWQYISLSNFGTNGYDGIQTVDIPLSAFSGLNPDANVGTVHTRFWYSSPFTVDITSIKVLSSSTPVPTPTPIPTPTPTPIPSPSVTYTGEYFDNKTLTGTPKLIRQDELINFYWNQDSPDPLIPVDNFSVRWTRILSLSAGDYLFTTISDDGVRLKIDGNTVINKWFDQGPTTYTSLQNLAAGNHTVVLEYYENGGGAVVNFSYEPVAPPTPTPIPTPSATYSGDYFANQSLTGTPTFTRQDTAIDFDWSQGSPDPLIPVDHFSIRWTRVLVLSEGNYTFTTTSDDGVRLAIDGNIVIDKWIDQGPTSYTTSIPLTSGNHTVVLEYYENGGGAVANFSYASTASPTPTPTATPTPVPPSNALYSFEDGTIMGWLRDNNITTVTNSTDISFSGTKSLKAHLNFPGGGWASGLLVVNSNLLQPNNIITAKIYAPIDINNASVSIFFQDNTWSWRQSPQWSSLTAGQWNTVSWDVTGVNFTTPINRFGFQVGSNDSNNLDIFLDDIDITP